MKRVNANILIAGTLTASFSLGVQAGTVTGTVVDVSTRASDGLTYVVINGTATGQPTCATHSYWMIMNETSDVGKRQYALFLVAKTSGAQVTIIGNNTCSRWPDGEDINEVGIVQ